MALTDLQLRKMRLQDKVIRFDDERGMYIELHPNGSMYWRFKYRYLGKEKRLALGFYPEIYDAFCFAVATGRAERDPCPDLQGAISPLKAENFPVITEPKEAGALLRALDAFEGALIVCPP